MKATTDNLSTQIGTDSNKLPRWLPISMILLIAAGLYLYQLGTESLWIDEIYSLRDANAIGTESGRLMGLNVTRPLYYILLRIWMFISTSDAWLRSLAAIFALGSIFLTYRLGRRLVGERVGLIAALLLALSPLFINHAQEIRMYTLSTLLTLAGTLALCHGLERPRNTWIGAWAIVRLLGILTTPINFTILVADVVIIAWHLRQQRRDLFRFAIALLFVISVWLPLLVHFQQSASEYMNSWVSLLEKPGITQTVSKLTSFTVYWPLFHLTEQPIAFTYYKVFTLVLVGLLGVALLNKRISEKLLWLAAWAFLPVAAMLFISYVSKPVFLTRYILFTAPYFLILFAAGFIRLWNWKRVVAIAVAVAYAIAVTGGLTHYYTTTYREDWRGVVQTINTEQQPGDVVGLYATLPDVEQAVDWYYEGAAPVYRIERLPTDENLGTPELEQTLSNLPEVRSRFWMICWLHCDDTQALNRVFQTAAGDNFQVVKKETYPGDLGKVELFLVAPGTATKPNN